MKGAALALALFLLAASAALADPRADALFREGNAAYREGRFVEAVDRYSQVRSLGLTSGPLEYNLGNAHYRLGAIGKATACYRRALRSLPRDGDLRANLSFVEARTIDQTLAPSRLALLDVPSRLASRLTWREWLVAGEIAYGAALALATLFLFRPSLRPRLRTPLQGALVVFGLALLLFLAAVRDQAIDRRGCVIAGEVPVRSGPGPRFTEEFVLHQGTVGRLLRSTEGWTLLRISPELEGWVPSTAIEEI